MRKASRWLRRSDRYARRLLSFTSIQSIAVTPNNGSYFTTFKMMEGFLASERIKTTHAGSMLNRLEAMRQGKVAAASVMEPWISLARKQGLRFVLHHLGLVDVGVAGNDDGELRHGGAEPRSSVHGVLGSWPHPRAS